MLRARFVIRTPADWPAQERERAYGLPVSVMLAPDAASKAKMELGFIEFGTQPLWLWRRHLLLTVCGSLSAVVRPLFVTLARIAPSLEGFIKLIDANTTAWRKTLN